MLGANILILTLYYWIVTYSVAVDFISQVIDGEISYINLIFRDMPVYVVCFILPLMCVYLFFVKSKHFPKLCTVLFVALAVWKVYELFRYFIILETVWGNVSIEIWMHQILNYSAALHLIQVLVWPIYLKNSGRVRNTFIN
ncbi:hypothetical protein DEV91_13630 [Phyllobacterium brassicacearum]|nr:hypothetical protein DEV91_13630 [Phyllobacterium brassicacearum]